MAPRTERRDMRDGVGPTTLESSVDEMARARRQQIYDRRWWTLIVLSVSLLIVIIDDTIINVALPTLQRELDASSTQLQWMVDAYIIVFAGLLFTAGTLGDRFGRRRFLQLGLVVFAGASAFGAYASTADQLIAARALMGVGGALIMPSTLSVLIDVFPREERVKAIGIWTGVASLGIPIGPIVGGWLLENFWWGSVFLLNVPIAIVALAAGRFLVPESRNPSPRRLDVVGMVLSGAALTALVYGVIEAPYDGWASWTVLGSIAGAFLAAAAFVAYERRVRDPMLDLRLFRNPRLTWGTVAMTIAALALGGLAFELTQFLQFVQGYSPLQAGLRFLPLAIGFGIAGPLTNRLVPKFGSARTVAVALAVVGVQLGLLSFAWPDISYALVGASLFLIGLGIGGAFIPSTDAVMAAVPEANAGIGSAINDAGRQVGAALGIGIVGAIANAGYTGAITDAANALPPPAAAAAERSVGAALQIADGLGGAAGAALRTAADSAFIDGFGAGLLAAALLAVAGALLVLWRLPARDIQAIRPLALSSEGGGA
jgi:EmrB/QacA subfamily drug resistance transporter